jgi:hypothetical protein
MTIVNDDSSVIIKWSFKLIDAARGIIYDRHMFIVQATGIIIAGKAWNLPTHCCVCDWVVAYLVND